MSLNVYLYERDKETVVCPHCQQSHEISRKGGEVYSANITYNLTRMADEAGIYTCLWRPEEVPIEKAGDLIEPLRKGLALLEGDPGKYKAFDSPIGWGTYDDFVPLVAGILRACENHPEAEVRVSR